MSFSPSIRYHDDVGIAYVRLAAAGGIEWTEELDDVRNVDHAADGRVIGVEFVETDQGVDLTGVPQPDTVRQLLESKGIQIRVPAK